MRVPNERIVVLGGLTSSQEDDVVNQVPLLGDIPAVGELFKTRSKVKTSDTLYIFIRPVILGDPAFRDLIYLSQEDAKRVALSQKDQPSNPLRLLGERPSSGIIQP